MADYGNYDIVDPETGMPIGEAGQLPNPTEYRSVMQRWRDAVGNFSTQYQRLLDNEQKAKDLGDHDAWYQQALQAGHTQAAIETIADQLAQVSEWTKSTFGLGLLGVLPLVPIAAIIGSISAVTAVVYALKSYNADLEQKWAYVNAHPELTPQQVGEVMNAGPLGGSLTAGLGSTITWIVIGGALLMFAPELLAMMKLKRSR